MKITNNGNMYEGILKNTWELFGAYLHGAPEGLICVVSNHTLETKSQSALNQALASRGYGEAPCTFISLEQPPEPTLDDQAIFLLLEGLDPLFIIAADFTSTQALNSAYRTHIATDSSCQLFGRPCVAFTSFADMLAGNKTKQKAWSLLKSLPVYGERT